MAPISVPFTNTKQEETFWCWAAVAANVYNCLFPPTSATPAVQQCDVVRMVKGSPNGDPCANKDTYNDTDAVDSALTQLKIIDLLPSIPRFQSFVNELSGVAEKGDKISPDVPEPLCVEIDFPNNAVHFVAISGVDPASKHVWVEDPYLGPGNTVEFAYDDFVSNYGYKHGPTGGVAAIYQRVKRL